MDSVSMELVSETDNLNTILVDRGARVICAADARIDKLIAAVERLTDLLERQQENNRRSTHK